MSVRRSVAAGCLIFQVGSASAADLSREAVPHATAGLGRSQAVAVRLRAACVEGDDPVVLRCLPQVELPPSFGRGEEWLATLARSRGRPYRQVFSWGD